MGDENRSEAGDRLREVVAGLRVPAVAAPMTGVSTPELVAAACGAGIIGSFPTSNAGSVAELDEWLERLARIPTVDGWSGPAGPVMANLIVGRQNRRLDDDLACVVRHRVSLVVTSVGSPAPVVEPLHRAGCLVVADVATVAHAHKALAAGADGLVLLAAGAGGHTGAANPLAFVRAVRSFFDGPLAVAGGMSDGAALWSAVVSGYDLGWFGTRFIATVESAASAAWKQAVVTSSLDDVALTVAANGVAASVLAAGGSAGHTVSAVEREANTAEVVGELAEGWHRARTATAALLG